MNKTIITMLLCMLGPTLYAQKFENLALTPPMGWSTWNTFQADIDETLIKEVADAFVELGFKDAGYRFINIDDAWSMRERDARGNLVPDPNKFPSGIKALADYIHARGLKIGIYGCAGNRTCGGYPGSRGHEYQDARRFAAWDIDFLKYDWCNTDDLNAKGAYATMRDALYAAGRPMVFELCEWGNNQPWEWAAEVGHLWRISGDITNCWDCEVKHDGWSEWGVMQIVNMRQGIRRYAGPGHWNDPDMLEVGNGMTESEDRAHFSLWCMLAAPLIMGNDVRKASPETIAILTNPEAIAVNQDALGIQGFKYREEEGLEIWAKPLSDNAWAICFLNRNDQPYALQFDWSAHPIVDKITRKEIKFDATPYHLRDVWAHKDLGTTADALAAEIPVHDVLMLKVSKHQ